MGHQHEVDFLALGESPEAFSPKKAGILSNRQTRLSQASCLGQGTAPRQPAARFLPGTYHPT
jgi:hypothetical protein